MDGKTGEPRRRRAEQRRQRRRVEGHELRGLVEREQLRGRGEHLARTDESAPRGVFGKFLATFRSFSAVSAPIFASKYAFYSIFQNLPDSLAEFSKFSKMFNVAEK